MIAVSIQWTNKKGLWHVAQLYETDSFWFARMQATLYLMNAVEFTKNNPTWAGADQFADPICNVTLHMVNEHREFENQFLHRFQEDICGK